MGDGAQEQQEPYSGHKGHPGKINTHKVLFPYPALCMLQATYLSPQDCAWVPCDPPEETLRILSQVLTSVLWGSREAK